MNAPSRVPENKSAQVNFLLSKRMDALSWLVRCQLLITDKKKGSEIIAAYGTSELPVDDITKTKTYHN